MALEKITVTHYLKLVKLSSTALEYFTLRFFKKIIINNDFNTSIFFPFLLLSFSLFLKYKNMLKRETRSDHINEMSYTILLVMKTNSPHLLK